MSWEKQELGKKLILLMWPIELFFSLSFPTFRVEENTLTFAITNYLIFYLSESGGLRDKD